LRFAHLRTGFCVVKMANRRMLSKSISTSKKLNKVSDFAAFLFTWLIPHCDDGGNMDGYPHLIKGIVFPLRQKSEKEIENALEELKKAKILAFYRVKSESYLHINQWEQHQTLRGDRPDFRYPTGKPKVDQRLTRGKHNGTEHNGTKHNVYDGINNKYEQLVEKKQFPS